MENIKRKDILKLIFEECNDINCLYRKVMVLSDTLLSIPAKNNGKILFNCQNESRIHMKVQTDGSVSFYGDSDSKIIKGLMAIMFSIINDENIIKMSIADASDLFKYIGIGKIFEDAIPMGFGLVVDEVELVLNNHFESVDNSM